MWEEPSSRKKYKKNTTLRKENDCAFFVHVHVHLNVHLKYIFVYFCPQTVRTCMLNSLESRFWRRWTVSSKVLSIFRKRWQLSNYIIHISSLLPRYLIINSCNHLNFDDIMRDWAYSLSIIILNYECTSTCIIPGSSRIDFYSSAAKLSFKTKQASKYFLRTIICATCIFISKVICYALAFLFRRWIN